MPSINNGSSHQTYTTMIKENILIVTPYLPFPIDSGGAQAQFHMIDFLRKKLNIHLAFTYRSTPVMEGNIEQLRAVWPDVQLFPFVIKRQNFWYRKCRQILSSFNRWHENKSRKYVDHLLATPFDENIPYEFIDYLGGVIQKNNIKLVQVEFAKFQDLVYGFPEVKRIFIQHEIQFIRNERYMKGKEKISTCDTYQMRMIKGTEIAAMESCDAVVVLTEVDKEILQKEGLKVPLYVSPAVIPLPEIKLEEHYTFNDKLVFLGGSDHHPNYEGVMWFLKEVWPEILNKKPQTKLEIIGQWRQSYINKIKLNYTNVEFAGFVPSIEPHLEGAIMIVPILTGSGMRMKIVDAVNYGVPFVTTQVGVEGLDFQNGKDCFIANSPQDFAHCTLQLMDESTTQQSFRDHALVKIKEMMPTQQLLDKRLEVYKTVLSAE